MSRKIHTRTKIFFKNPYVVRVEYAESGYQEATVEYSKLTRKTYRLMQGTWGHTTLEHELTRNIFSAGNALDDTYDYGKLRGYFCFQDEDDALQFRLSIDATAIKVNMWPERWFTVHEVIND